MNAPARFKQSDITRALRGAQKAGLRVGRVEVDVFGKIIILSETVTAKEAANGWDDI